jgi:putative hemolysin
VIALLFLALGVLFSAFFSGVETALVSANRTRLSHRADEGDKAARTALRLLAEPRRLFGAALVGGTLASVFTATLATLWFERRFGEGVVPWVVLGLTALSLVASEILPKAVARAQADALTLRLAQLLDGFSRALAPIVGLMNAAASVLLFPLGVRTSPARVALSRQDFQILLDESEETGQVAPGQGRILSRVMDFGETTAGQVMRPRTEIEALESTVSVREAIARVRETGYTRLPAYRDDLDQIVGVVHLYDLLRAPNPDVPVEGLLRPITFVPDAKRADELLRELRSRHRTIAIVVDEYGGTAGLVTVEDLVEELVGDIKNEEEPAAVPVRRIDATRWAVDAQTRIEDVNEALELELPEGDYETIAGLVLERLGRIPRVGESVTLAGVRIEVQSADARSVHTLIVSKAPRDRRARDSREGA